MTQPARIDPAALYDDNALWLAAKLSSTSLAKGRKSGSLRYTRRGGRIQYFGRWILDWLASDETAESHEAQAVGA